jgi:hypothetical protein
MILLPLYCGFTLLLHFHPASMPLQPCKRIVTGELGNTWVNLKIRICFIWRLKYILNNEAYKNIF